MLVSEMFGFITFCEVHRIDFLWRIIRFASQKKTSFFAYNSFRELNKKFILCTYIVTKMVKTFKNCVLTKTFYMETLECLFPKKIFCERILQKSDRGLKVILFTIVTIPYERNLNAWENQSCTTWRNIMFTQRKTIKEWKLSDSFLIPWL